MRCPNAFQLLAFLLVSAAVQAGGGPAAREVTGPGGRIDFAFAYDSARQNTILFGGYDGAGTRNDTWTWSGTAWSELTPGGTLPLIRAHQAGAFDESRAELVVFGGTDFAGTTYNDVHLFNGTDWAPGAIDPSVPAADGEMAYDSNRSVTVLAVSNPFSSPFFETWERTGTTWAKIATANSPPARTDSQLVFDKSRNVCVLFGGFGGFSRAGDLNDTWEYNGTDWTLVTTAAAPTGRVGMAMAYHGNAVSGRVLLFGGSAGGELANDTWTYDGTNWTLQAPAHSPPVRWVAFLSYDANRDRSVLYGGEDAGGLRNDLWEWDGSDWTEGGSAPPAAPTTFILY